ncbi:hypothetical protein [Kribbella sp. VKM Ac-2568]|uniref:hypothetical protein n=1 Tax=Kribbella sp. VKM Ac-2568 TaxID=2512219 RepID=UPI00104B89F5|nr:hypothetical protein [Kribbella sp. VKM Ac-2568]TCM45915.1 hypothetical protein EV648_106381 [Kribbella sp. VKM Ac-2568]
MIIAVDADSRDTLEAEHLLHQLLATVSGPIVACTHMVPGGDRPHLAVSISGSDLGPLGGRLGTDPVADKVGSAIIRAGAAELRERGGIDEVEALGGLPVEDDTVIDTLDFVRPIRRNGRVVLLVQPTAGGVLIPFEVEHQQKCCVDH